MNKHAPDLAVPVSASDHSQGRSDAGVILLEYGDYQCPACRMAYPVVKRIQNRFDTGLRFVFRNFPLTQAHPLAHPAAEVAEASAVLHHFWPMHDWLYENQDDWVAFGAAGLEAGLRALGIDEAAAAQAVRGRDIDARIRADFMGGVRSGVNGTPCFFVNGFRYDGDSDSLEEVIASLIERL